MCEYVRCASANQARCRRIDEPRTKKIPPADSQRDGVCGITARQAQKTESRWLTDARDGAGRESCEKHNAGILPKDAHLSSLSSLNGSLIDIFKGQILISGNFAAIFIFRADFGFSVG